MLKIWGDALKEEKLVDGTRGIWFYIETVDGGNSRRLKSGMVVYHQRRRDTNTSADLTPIADGNIMS